VSASKWLARAVVTFGLSVAEPAPAADSDASEPKSERAAADSRMYAADSNADGNTPAFDGVMASQLLPLQYDVLRLRGDGEHRTGSALLTGFSFYSLGREDVRIGRAALDGKLGGGDAGFDGILRTDFGNGLCLPGVPNCLFGRTLLNFELRGNDRYFSRWLRLGMELGYFYAGRNLVVDFGLNAALPLFGVTKVGDERAESRLSVSPGASALVAYSYGRGHWRLSADAARYQVEGGEVDRVNAELCGGGAHFSLCSGLDYFALDESGSRDAIVTSIAFSFTAGGGVVHEAPRRQARKR
jgi:hypothetical protein